MKIHQSHSFRERLKFFGSLVSVVLILCCI